MTVADLLDPGYTPGIWEVATGSGKSIGLCWLLWSLWQRDALPEQVVIVTSRTDLVADLCAALRLFFPADMVGRWDGHRKRKGRLLVTTYPSLGRVVAKLGAVGLLCCDEVHRSAARSVRRTIEAIPWRFGMSATPFLGDKARRIVGFERVLYTLTRAEAEEQGIIVPFDPLWVQGEPVESGDRALRAGVAMVEARGGPSVLGAGLITARTLADAEAMAAICRAAGWIAIAVSGETPRKERAVLKARIADGEPIVLVSVILLSEGIDIPRLNWLLLAAPLTAGSRQKLVQFIGRVVRAAPGKTQALVFDPAAQLQIFGLVHDPALGSEKAPKPLPKSAKRAAKIVLADLERLPYAVRMGRLELWAASLRFAVERMEPDRSKGLPRLGIGERALAPPVQWWGQMEDLLTGKGLGLLQMSRAKGAQAFTGDPHRELIRAVVAGRGASSGVVSDLSAVLKMLNGRWVSRCGAAWGRYRAGGPMAAYQRAAHQARVVVRVEVPGRA